MLSVVADRCGVMRQMAARRRLVYWWRLACNRADSGVIPVVDSVSYNTMVVSMYLLKMDTVRRTYRVM